MGLTLCICITVLGSKIPVIGDMRKYAAKTQNLEPTTQAQSHEPVDRMFDDWAIVQMVAASPSRFITEALHDTKDVSIAQKKYNRKKKKKKKKTPTDRKQGNR